jgi:hypothetical protein
MFTSFKNIKRVRLWEAADNLFLVKAPRGWSDDERPLDAATKHHYRVRRSHDGGSCDLVLYHTPMVRLFRPDGGRREVWVHPDPRQTSSQFLWHAAGFSKYTASTTTDGRRVSVGINPGATASDGWPVKLVYINGKLDIAQSTDAPNSAGARTSPERKQQRKELRQFLQTYKAMGALMDGVPVFGSRTAADCLQEIQAGNEVDPTPLASFIKDHSIDQLVNYVHPLGDVVEYDPPFKEIEE